MGQYYSIINLSKKQYMNSWDYNSGAKLTETCYIGPDMHSNEYLGTLSYLLQNDWAGDRVIFIGDYANKDWADETKCGDTKPKEFARALYEEFKDEIPKTKYSPSLYDLTDAYTPYKEQHDEKIPRFLINNHTKEYVDLTKLASVPCFNEMFYYPLSLLLAIGNGLGNGDYHGNDENDIGYWCADSQYISFSAKKPQGYNELSDYFVEKE